MIVCSVMNETFYWVNWVNRIKQKEAERDNINLEEIKPNNNGN